MKELDWETHLVVMKLFDNYDQISDYVNQNSSLPHMWVALYKWEFDRNRKILTLNNWIQACLSGVREHKRTFLGFEAMKNFNRTYPKDSLAIAAINEAKEIFPKNWF